MNRLKINNSSWIQKRREGTGQTTVSKIGEADRGIEGGVVYWIIRAETYKENCFWNQYQGRKTSTVTDKLLEAHCGQLRVKNISHRGLPQYCEISSRSSTKFLQY